VTIRSDDHKSYPPAIRQLRARVRHLVTSSKERLDQRNRLWEVNLLDGLIRHSEANHRRETLAWAKRRVGSALRLAIFLVWRNYVKRRWEKRGRETPAMRAGVCGRALLPEDILTCRIFPSRVGLEGRWADYYWKRVMTPALGRNRTHELTRAA